MLSYVGAPCFWLAGMRDLLLAIASCFFLSISAAEHFTVPLDETNTAKKQKNRVLLETFQKILHIFPGGAYEI